MSWRPSALLMFALALVVATSSQPAYAWHRSGHMAVARIAWQELVEAGLGAKLVEILQHHPHRALFLEAGRPSDVAADEWLFVQAATWSDWVQNPRGEGISPEDAAAIRKKYGRGSWHFVNLPIVAADEAARFDEAAIRKECLEPEYDASGEPRHALAAQDRAVALCWVLHLVGDIHQPLHSATLISAAARFRPQQFLPPQGDNGGNRLAIKVANTDRNATELHAFWDARVFGDSPYPQVRRQVLLWTKETDFGRAKFAAELKKADALDWAEESRVLAISAAYRGSGGPLPALALPPHHGPADLIGLDAPVLPAGYQAAADAVAKKRLALAGYRLADVLRTRFAPPADPSERGEHGAPVSASAGAATARGRTGPGPSPATGRPALMSP
jgi:hypothetical protein